MKYFIGTCIENPFSDINELIEIIDKAEEITSEEFIVNCDANDEILKQIKRFPYDFNFHKNGNIYFFTHSMIEHFYK